MVGSSGPNLHSVLPVDRRDVQKQLEVHHGSAECHHTFSQGAVAGSQIHSWPTKCIIVPGIGEGDGKGKEGQAGRSEPWSRGRASSRGASGPDPCRCPWQRFTFARKMTFRRQANT